MLKNNVKLPNNILKPVACVCGICIVQVGGGEWEDPLPIHPRRLFKAGQGKGWTGSAVITLPTKQLLCHLKRPPTKQLKFLFCQSGKTFYWFCIKLLIFENLSHTKPRWTSLTLRCKTYLSWKIKYFILPIRCNKHLHKHKLDCLNFGKKYSSGFVF